MTRESIGKYRLVELLGRGAMGAVYLAEDPVLERQVAIKLLREEGDEQARERFLLEARAIARLSHPGIVTLLEYGIDAGSPFLVMEYLPGSDLDTWMREPHSMRERLRVLLDVARALDAAHHAGVLHRDLKPSNVRVLSAGGARLVDFGIALAGGGRLTATGMMIGTPQCMAPELLADNAPSLASELWALGVLCREVLSGANPFAADTVEACLTKVLTLDPASIGNAVAGLSLEIVELLDSCLARDPRRRPGSAAVVVAALERELERGNPELARAPTRRLEPAQLPAVAPAKPLRRARSRVGWGLAAAVLVVAGGLWLLRGREAPPGSRDLGGEHRSAEARPQEEKPPHPSEAGTVAPGSVEEAPSADDVSKEAAAAAGEPASPPAAGSAPASSRSPAAREPAAAGAPGASRGGPTPHEGAAGTTPVPAEARGSQAAQAPSSAGSSSQGASPDTQAAAQRTAPAPSSLPPSQAPLSSAPKTSPGQSPTTSTQAGQGPPPSLPPPAELRLESPRPRLTAVEPPSVRRGSVVEITLRGKDLPAGARLSVRGGRSQVPGVRISKLEIAPTAATVTLFIGEDVPLGPLRLSLEADGVEPTNSLILEVRL